MKGVDYANTSYRRMYRPTPAFKLLGYEAQSAYWALRSVLDPGGFFQLHGYAPVEALAVELGCYGEAQELLRTGLDRLLEKEWIVYLEDEDALFDPEFFDSEQVARSDKQRSREYRQRKRLTAIERHERRAEESRTRLRRNSSIRPVKARADREAGDPDTELRAVASHPRTIGFPIGPEASTVTKRDAPVTPGAAQNVTTVTKRDGGETKRDGGETKRDGGLTNRDGPVTMHHKEFVDDRARPAVGEKTPKTKGLSGEEALQDPALRDASVTKRDAAVTKRDGTVTNANSYSYSYSYSSRQAASESVSAGARASPPGTAEHPRVERLAADRAFQDFAQKVERSFGRATSSTRLLNPSEAKLVREWFDLSIDPGLIDETLVEKARAASRPVRSLLYFREPVREAWARHRELVSCDPPDALPPPALDFARCLDGLVAAIPLDVPDRRGLVEEVGGLRELARADPERAEDRLRAIETRYLERIDLSPDQTRTLEQALVFLARTVPAGSLPEHRKRISNQLKREGLGLPALTLSADPTRNPPSLRGIRKELPTCDPS